MRNTHGPAPAESSRGGPCVSLIFCVKGTLTLAHHTDQTLGSKALALSLLHVRGVQEPLHRLQNMRTALNVHPRPVFVCILVDVECGPLAEMQ